MSAASLKQLQTGNRINFITSDTLIGLPCNLDYVEYNKLFFILFHIITDWHGFEHSVCLEDELLSVCLSACY